MSERLERIMIDADIQYPLKLIETSRIYRHFFKGNFSMWMTSNTQANP